ncbi:hypothetical protein ABPG72_008471 [Tetrahymena utriculariae]
MNRQIQSSKNEIQIPNVQLIDFMDTELILIDKILGLNNGEICQDCAGRYNARNIDVRFFANISRRRTWRKLLKLHENVICIQSIQCAHFFEDEQMCCRKLTQRKDWWKTIEEIEETQAKLLAMRNPFFQN